ncbi:sodium/potassium/calcium exchanger 1 isoform X2 [Peromyscus californicus insignis]|uniref:sodium/potassium/calcium exchanger 1 isoform X2 n=1 Tax=Peromyscus californicus insignis TaxID=564181 RepID=UPI0022A791E0|nr:sodium/potassium/calcium exchanger 1 isoform X2 [Peromyscus californicus insignis]
MGKLLRMGTQERRLSRRPKRLHWSRLFFLLGMLIIGSTYQHLRRPWNSPSMWTKVSSQQPIKLASRDLPSDEMIAVGSDPPEASSEVDGELLAPQNTVIRDEATPSMTMEDTPSPPRTTKITPTSPKNNYSPIRAGRERETENTPPTPSRASYHFISTSGRERIRSYTPIPRGERRNSIPTHSREKGRKYTSFPAGAPSDTTPTATEKDSKTMATYRLLETRPPERRAEETAAASFKRVVPNTPTFLTPEVEASLLASPSLVEENTLGSPRKEEQNSSAGPQGAVPQHTPATSEEQVNTRMGHTPAAIQASTVAWRISNPLSRTSVPTIRIASATNRELAKRPPTAHSAPVTPKGKALLTTQVHRCVVVEPAPAVPMTSSPSMTNILFPEAPSSSPSVLPPGWPNLYHKAEYPPDLFSVEDRRQGWVALHIFGMMYVFVALAIVCDEYFVPALGVITDKLQISEDVAGATFMAAGGSAPELFTSLIGVFISHSNVGIGTIVGSAVFNILFVIGTCALFSREILNLTWWPLFRDVSFYILDLSMLILFFLDSLIAWWESLLLLLAYALYVFTMKWNKQIELWVKEQLSRRPVAKVMALGDLSKPSDGAVEENKPQDNERLKEDVGEAGHTGDMTREEGETEAEGKEDEEGETEAEGKEDEGETEAEGKVVDLEGETEAEGNEDEQEGETEAEGKDEQEGETEAEGNEDEQEGETEAEGKDEQEGETEAEGKIVELEGETEAEGKVVELEGETEAEGKEDEQEGETEAEGKEDEHEGETEAEGKEEEQEGETEAEGKEDEHEGEGGIRADDAEVKAGEGETEADVENQCETTQGEKGADGEGGSDGGDSGEEEDDEEEEEEEEEEESEEPLSLEWPESRQKQAIYLFLLPIVFPLWLTVPDVRRQESRKFFVITFLGSIIWIAMFSYLMVWWAHQVGETIGISEEIMGLTILAAGTSIPDLITSVIVARKGLGDMAVSSSVGSNIFDITVGLPVPWLLFSLINTLQPVPVSSNGLFCAIVLLFLMLLFVIFSIASCKWRMNKILGFTMFLLYFVFLVISVMLEDRIISCPVSV